MQIWFVWKLKVVRCDTLNGNPFAAWQSFFVWESFRCILETTGTMQVFLFCIQDNWNENLKLWVCWVRFSCVFSHLWAFCCCFYRVAWLSGDPFTHVLSPHPSNDPIMNSYGHLNGGWVWLQRMSTTIW